MRFLLIFLLVISCSSFQQDAARELASGGKSNSVISSNKRSIETIAFHKSRILKINAPEIKCPVELLEAPICFHSSPHGRGNLVLDPGHDLSISSLRNGRHDKVHEGRANMTVAIIARQLIRKCLSYSSTRKTGIKEDSLFLSHYPGETFYGDFEMGNVRRNNTNRIKETGGDALFSHVNKLLSRGASRSKGVLISIHADAPDHLDDASRASEYPAVFFRRTRKNSGELARELYESLIEVTSGYYSSKQRESFVVSKNFYPKLTMAGVPQASVTKAQERFKLNNEKVEIRVWRREVSKVMRAGSGDAYISTRSLGRRSMRDADISADKKKTEVALMEGFFMDGVRVGEEIQASLSARNLYELKFQSSMSGPQNLKEINFDGAKIEILPPKKGKLTYKILKNGKKEKGLKISPFYIKYATAIVLGLQKRYSCR